MRPVQGLFTSLETTGARCPGHGVVTSSGQERSDRESHGQEPSGQDVIGVPSGRTLRSRPASPSVRPAPRRSHAASPGHRRNAAWTALPSSGRHRSGTERLRPGPQTGRGVRLGATTCPQTVNCPGRHARHRACSQEDSARRGRRRPGSHSERVRVAERPVARPAMPSTWPLRAQLSMTARPPPSWTSASTTRSQPRRIAPCSLMRSNGSTRTGMCSGSAARRPPRP